MRRHIAIIATVIAAFAFTCTGADAHWKGHRKIDKRVTAVGIGASVVSTVTFGELIHWNWNYKDPATRWGAWGATTLGCAIISPLVAQAFVPERPLTGREVSVLVGSCVVPIIGGLIVNALYDANPEWEGKVVKVGHRHHKKKKM